VFDHAERRGRLAERLRDEGVDLLVLGLSDLEYLSGVEHSRRAERPAGRAPSPAT